MYREGDLHELSSDELIGLFDHPNKWVRQRAMLELGWRDDQVGRRPRWSRSSESGSLESLWALNLMGELTTERAVKWLRQSRSAYSPLGRATAG